MNKNKYLLYWFLAALAFLAAGALGFWAYQWK